MTRRRALQTICDAAYGYANGHERAAVIHTAIRMMNPRSPLLPPTEDGPECPQCGQHGCDCEPDGDSRTRRERLEEQKADRDFDFDRGEP